MTAMNTLLKAYNKEGIPRPKFFDVEKYVKALCKGLAPRGTGAEIFVPMVALRKVLANNEMQYLSPFSTALIEIPLDSLISLEKDGLVGMSKLAGEPFTIPTAAGLNDAYQFTVIVVKMTPAELKVLKDSIPYDNTIVKASNPVNYQKLAMESADNYIRDTRQTAVLKSYYVEAMYQEIIDTAKNSKPQAQQIYAKASVLLTRSDFPSEDKETLKKLLTDVDIIIKGESVSGTTGTEMSLEGDRSPKKKEPKQKKYVTPISTTEGSDLPVNGTPGTIASAQEILERYRKMYDEIEKTTTTMYQTADVREFTPQDAKDVLGTIKKLGSKHTAKQNQKQSMDDMSYKEMSTLMQSQRLSDDANVRRNKFSGDESTPGSNNIPRAKSAMLLGKPILQTMRELQVKVDYETATIDEKIMLDSNKFNLRKSDPVKQELIKNNQRELAKASGEDYPLTIGFSNCGQVADDRTFNNIPVKGYFPRDWNTKFLKTVKTKDEVFNRKPTEVGNSKVKGNRKVVYETEYYQKYEYNGLKAISKEFYHHFEPLFEDNSVSLIADTIRLDGVNMIRNKDNTPVDLSSIYNSDDRGDLTKMLSLNTTDIKECATVTTQVSMEASFSDKDTMVKHAAYLCIYVPGNPLLWKCTLIGKTNIDFNPDFRKSRNQKGELYDSPNTLRAFFNIDSNYTAIKKDVASLKINGIRNFAVYVVGVTNVWIKGALQADTDSADKVKVTAEHGDNLDGLSAYESAVKNDFGFDIREFPNLKIRHKTSARVWDTSKDDGSMGLMEIITETAKIKGKQVKEKEYKNKYVFSKDPKNPKYKKRLGNGSQSNYRSNSYRTY